MLNKLTGYWILEKSDDSILSELDDDLLDPSYESVKNGGPLSDDGEEHTNNIGSISIDGEEHTNDFVEVLKALQVVEEAQKIIKWFKAIQ